MEDVEVSWGAVAAEDVATVLAPMVAASLAMVVPTPLLHTVKPSPSCYRVSQIFSPISHMTPCPLADGGGGPLQFSQKHNFKSIMCIF